MFSNVERSSSEAMLPAPTPEGTERLSSWRNTRIKRFDRNPSRRVRTLIGAIVATCTLTGLLTWATTTVSPIPYISVSLASTDYRDNLNLPINGFGDLTIGRWAAWTTSEDPTSRRHVELFTPPIELASKSDFARIQVDPKANVALVYISAHGVSTSNGPALLAASAQGLTDAVPVKSLLVQLAQLPERQKKVLMLDASNFVALPSFGILNNNFARQIRGLGAEIAAIPNLVVMLSADEDQQSWIHPAQGTTAWAAAILNALNGSATDRDNDGWIDIQDVHSYVSESTQSFTSKVCGVVQKPVLLPSGSEGTDRSRDIAIVPQLTLPVEIPALSFPPRASLLSQWWQQHDQFKNRSIHPAAMSPVLWRRFEKTLLRLEQFELAGCRDAADSCVKEIESLSAMLNQPSLIDSVACRAGVLCPELIGFNSGTDLASQADQICNRLLDLSIDEASREWLSIVEGQPNSETVAFLRRTIIDIQIRRLIATLRSEKSIDRERLERTATLINCISDPTQPIAQPGLMVQLVARDLPQDANTTNDFSRLARWLELSLHADSLFENGRWWAPQIVPWAQRSIGQADQQRRFAGDLLFGEVATRERADGHLANSESAYLDVNRIAAVITDAEIACSVGQYQLSRLRDLISLRLTDSTPTALLTQTREVEHLYRLLDAISGGLTAAPSDEAGKASSELAKIENTVAQFNEKLRNLSNLIDSWQADPLAGKSRRLPDVLAALQETGGSPTDRMSAWNRVSQLANSDNAESHWAVPVDTPSRVKDAAAIRGRLALASWPNQGCELATAVGCETKAQVLHRLEIFAAESQWWNAVDVIGDAIAKRETLLAKSLAAANAAPNVDFRWLTRSELIAPIEARQVLLDNRREIFARYLTFEAERFFEDGYASLDSAMPSHCERVRELLNYDANTLRARMPSSLSQPTPSALADTTEQPIELKLDCPNQMIWTTQSTDQLVVNLKSHGMTHDGYAVLWAQANGSFTLNSKTAQTRSQTEPGSLGPIANPRVCRKLVSDTPSGKIGHQQLDNDFLISIDRMSFDNAGTTDLDVFGYFRGHRLHKSVQMKSASEPEIQFVQSPRASGARFAVRSPEAIISGTGTAVTLVLDCSGSMGAGRGESFGPQTKYAQAIAAVETILDDLPSGTQLSIWCFGQAIGHDKTVHPAERSIRQIQAPFAWDAGDLQLKKLVMDSISYPTLEPWNESPLLATLIAAANDLRAYNGLKSLVVITDGFDNRIVADEALNPLSLTPEQLIKKHFSGTGITLNVIAFRVEQGDESNTQRQLRTVESLLPPGRFVQLDQSAELAKAMADMLHVSSGVTIQPANAKQVPADEIKLSFSAAADAPANWSPELAPGLYHVASDSEARPTLVEVRDGDRIILGLTPHGDFSLWPIMRHDLRWCPQRQINRWTVALEPIAGSMPGSIQRRVILWGDANSGTVSIQQPGDLWIEATANNQRLPITCHAASELPRSSFDITVRCESTVAPQFKVWLSERAAIPVGSLRRGREFNHFADIAPAAWQVDDQLVQLQSMAIEFHDVPDERGALTSQPCLVLRASMPSGSEYRLRTEGLTFSGADEQFFASLGRYTLRQWPITIEDVEKTIKAIHLISIEQFKRDAEHLGGTATFESTANPMIPSTSNLTTSISPRSRP